MALPFPRAYSETMGVFPARRTAIILSIVALVLVLTGAGWMLWNSSERIKQLERQSAAAREQANATLRQMTAHAAEMERVAKAAQEARAQAVEALRNAVAAAEGRDLAEADAAAARDEAERKERLAQEAQQELEAMKQRRDQELDRMHEALARIAKTRRTSSGMVVELAQESFQFDFDSAELRQPNREILSRIAGVLLASKGYRLAIHGHTDDVGTAAYNMQLSQRRADAVADYLKKCGISDDTLTTQGFGKASPRERGTDSDARQKNRRVEIAIVDSIIKYQGIPAKQSAL
jgi:outer membrane protein OmpA-like peptidoglycan-associated protein